MTCAIKVENLGKKYNIKHHQQSRYQYKSLGESLSRGFRNLGKTLLHPLHSDTSFDNTEEFWALEDINFEIEHGDRVGIIGRNGAGKSTLLKILSRITHPTTGKVTLNGRVSSLLEVGTGFHPELTGRENIFLNGAILGMRKSEIQRKFDEIVDFAEVEKFLDTPVKHYSSGMYVRLAFAVAAHLEPEILIVDEVLAVGDIQFQRKCIGKMEDISNKKEKTILFVSHNMQAIKQLCTNAICLEKGKIEFIGTSHEGIGFYYSKNRPGSIDFKDTSEGACITNVQFLDNIKQIKNRFSQQEVMTVRLEIILKKHFKQLNTSMAISHGEFGPVFSEHMADYIKIDSLEPGKYFTDFEINLSYLKPESYFLTIHLVDLEKGEVASYIHNVPLPEIYLSGADCHLESVRWGVVRIPVSFQMYRNAF